MRFLGTFAIHLPHPYPCMKSCTHYCVLSSQVYFSDKMTSLPPLEDGLTRDSDGCIVLRIWHKEGVQYINEFEVETEERLYFNIKYKLKGTLQCKEKTILFVSQSCGNAENCEVSRRDNCLWVDTLNNVYDCHVRCYCVGGRCQGRLLVTGIPNMCEWSLCDIKLN